MLGLKSSNGEPDPLLGYVILQPETEAARPEGGGRPPITTGTSPRFAELTIARGRRGLRGTIRGRYQD